MSTVSESESMYAIGSEIYYGSGQVATRRGNGGGRRAAPAPDDFDFEACDVVSETALRIALLTRSKPALDYIADVVEDLEENAEVCAHVIHALSRTPDLITCLTEIKRRCLITNVYTHSFFMRTVFLNDSVRVKVKAVTEKGAKQAAHIAFVKCLCEKVLAM